MRAHADTLVRAARAELSERMRQGPDDPFGNQATVETQMAVGMALLGEHAAATRTVEAALKKYPLQRDAIEVPGLLKWVAMVHLIAGRKADAIATLEQALSIPSDVTVPYLRMNPIYDGLRGEPGFRKLVGS